MRTTPDDLPENFDDIFPVNPDELVIPLTGELDYEQIANSFEAIADELKAKFEEDEDAGTVSITLPTGAVVTVSTADEQFVVAPARTKGCLKLIQEARANLRMLGQAPLTKTLLAFKEAKR